MKRFALVFAGLIMVGSLVFAAGGKAQDTTTVSSGPKVLHWSGTSEVTTMDSNKGYDTVSWEQMDIFTESLFKINGNNEPVPALAKALPTVSADGTVLTIDLKDNIRFSNGDRITAADFVYSFQRLVDPATGSQSANRATFAKNASDIIAGKQPPENIGVKALSDTRLEITLVAPNPYINTELSSSLYSPVSRSFVQAQGANYALSADTILSTGAYILKDWTGADISWRFEKNPYYWDAANVYFDEITWQIVKEVATRVALFEAGSLDGVLITGEYAANWKGAPDLVTINALRMTNLELGISSNPILQNLNLRKALNLAVNRKELTDAILAGAGVPAVGAIPNGIAVSPVNGKSIAEDFGNLLPYDVAQAQQYFAKALQELGRTSVTLRLVCTDTDESIKISQYLQSVYETNLPGLKIDVANVPASVRFAEMMSYKFDLALGGWTGEFDPATYIKQHETSNEHNHSKWVSPEITAIINALETSDGNDFVKRWEHLREANKYLIDNVVEVPLHQASANFLVNTRLKGLVFHVLGTPIDITRASY
ncbi:peptide ABC transporter substrate-binding protein [Spirochaetia bacterium]|nr:peptide ABC transporter substrate-binding protein [Spirochaetia bacterium]